MLATLDSRLRIDRWLWCVRFFKTRSLAAQAVRAGHVRLNGGRTKPSKEVRIGDVLSISKGAVEYEVSVRSLPSRRGPAREASLCYIEIEASIRRRRAQAEVSRAEALVSKPPTPGRPDKRTRRLMRTRARDDALSE